jgi:hypothetical protein
MSLKPDHKYNGRVIAGSSLMETQTGTLGYQVMLECEDGDISFTIWLTDKNKERAKKAFETLGVSVENLKDPKYIEFKLGMEITGREVSFGTKEETYKGTTSVKVVYIGKKTSANLTRSVANFFGGSLPEPESPITDEDIPF